MKKIIVVTFSVVILMAGHVWAQEDNAVTKNAVAANVDELQADNMENEALNDEGYGTDDEEYYGSENGEANVQENAEADEPLMENNAVTP